MTKRKSSTTTYRVLVGLNYPSAKPGEPEKRAEVGDIVSDLPSRYVRGLLERGRVEEVASSETEVEIEPVEAESPVEEETE